MKADLIIHLDIGPDKDLRELERHNVNLRSDLGRLEEVESVQPLPVGTAPTGSKVADPVSAGAILMTLLASKGVIVSLLDLLAVWLGREDHRSLTIQVGQSKFEMKGGSSNERKELADLAERILQKLHPEGRLPPMGGERFGLLVASSEFQNESLRCLSAPPADVEALAGVLRRSDVGGFDIETLVNQPRAVVELAMQSFFLERKCDDLVLLYFSGHGLKNDSNNLYFAMADTKPRYLEATAVSSRFVREMMQNCSARRQILLLDCCFSGAFPRGRTFRADETIGSGHYFDVKGSGQAILTASDDMQYAFEDDKLTMQKVTPSMFTKIVVEGIGSGEADTDLDGNITIDDLHAYVLERLRARNSRQTPKKWYFGLTDDIVLATNPNPHERASVEELRCRLESEDVRVKLGAVIDLGKLARGSDGRRRFAAIKALEALTKDDSRAVSAAAKAALSDIVGQVFGQTNGKPSGANENIGVQASPIVEPEGDVRKQSQPQRRAIHGNDSPEADHLTPPPVRTFKGHAHWIKSVAFSPDGTLLATGSRDKTIRLWCVADGTPVRTLKGHTHWVNSVAFSPDGTLLATGANDRTVRLWRVADGGPVRTLKGHTDLVNSVAFSPNGVLLATGANDRTVRLWRVATGEVRTLEGHAGLTPWIKSVAFSPDGTLLASGADDKTVRLWSLK